MTDSSLVPTGEPISDTAALTEEQDALAETARDEVEAFLQSPAGGVHEAAVAATTAIEHAVGADVSVDELSAVLEASPQAVQAILNHDINLEDLHPENNTD
ncbi:hypothetical protein [Frigoribacterium endophyticum]|uniref:hypothetical protein n=1 Tax=Frigoribacterium endophyticum TaxID=1522176 RepID=UPI00141FFA1B|nr:hypothetical protein [Frigoribacterium endophyticum]NII52157.1 hypothetical protein [Frigoribacterium endophyticum]